VWNLPVPTHFAVVWSVVVCLSRLCTMPTTFNGFICHLGDLYIFVVHVFGIFSTWLSLFSRIIRLMTVWRITWKIIRTANMLITWKIIRTANMLITYAHI